MILDRNEAAKNIKVFRYNMGYTQQELADFMKMEKRDIFRVEKYGEFSEMDLYSLAEIFYIKDIYDFYKSQEKKKLAEIQKKLKEIDYIFNSERRLKNKILIIDAKIIKKDMIFSLQRGKYVPVNECDDKWVVVRNYTLHWNIKEKCYLETNVLIKNELVGVNIKKLHDILIETNKKFLFGRCNIIDSTVYFAMPLFINRYIGYLNNCIDSIQLNNDLDDFDKCANEIEEYLKDAIEDTLLSNEELKLKKEKINKQLDDEARTEYEMKEAEHYWDNYESIEAKYGYDDDAIESSPEYWEKLYDIHDNYNDEEDVYYTAPNNLSYAELNQIDNEIMDIKKTIALMDVDTNIKVKNEKIPISYWELKYELKKKQDQRKNY